jgi:hypothetical protein
MRGFVSRVSFLIPGAEGPKNQETGGGGSFEDIVEAAATVDMPSSRSCH